MSSSRTAPVRAPAGRAIRRAAACSAIAVFGVCGAARADGVTPPSSKAPSGPSSPSADNVARADALFRAGAELRSAGLYADACPKFAQAERLAPGIGVALHLADCYEHIGKRADAWAEFHKAEELALAQNDRRAALARSRAKALEPKAAPPEAEPETAAPPSSPAPAGSAPSAAESVSLRAASVAPAAPSPTAARGPSPSAPVSIAPSPPAEAPVSMQSVPWGKIELGLLGSGVVAMALGGGLLAVKDHAIATNVDATPAGAGSAVAFAVGGAAVVSSIVLYLAAPADKASSWIIMPGVMPSGGGAFARGTF